MEEERNMDGKPISQMFADELDKLVEKYYDSGITNAEAIGVLEMTKHDILMGVRDGEERNQRPF